MWLHGLNRKERLRIQSSPFFENENGSRCQVVRDDGVDGDDGDDDVESENEK